MTNRHTLLTSAQSWHLFAHAWQRYQVADQAQGTAPQPPWAVDRSLLPLACLWEVWLCLSEQPFPLLQLQCTDENACGWRWLACQPAAAGLKVEAGSDGAGADSGSQTREAAAWREVANTRVYTPVEEDLGGWLCVECTPVARHAAFCQPGLHTSYYGYNYCADACKHCTVLL